MRVEWSKLARRNLEDLINYIRRDSAFYARRFAEKVFIATRQLKNFPASERNIPEAEVPILREIVVQGYRVMCRLESDRLLILAVIHGSRNIAGREVKPWEDF